MISILNVEPNEQDSSLVNITATDGSITIKAKGLVNWIPPNGIDPDDFNLWIEESSTNSDFEVISSEVEMRITRIGNLPTSCGGQDEYFDVIGLDQDITPKLVLARMLPLYWKDTNSPGQYYCTNIRCVQETDNRIIAIVEHRYNT